MLVVTITLLITSLAWAGSARAQTGLNDVPIGGIPAVGGFHAHQRIQQRKSARPVLRRADRLHLPRVSSLPSPGSPRYEIGLLDSGAQLRCSPPMRRRLSTWPAKASPAPSSSPPKASQAPNSFGSKTRWASLPPASNTHPRVAADRPAGPRCPGHVADTTTLRGLTSNSPATAPAGSALPNVIGLPMMATHTTVIRNSQPQFLQDGDTTFRAPSIEFLPRESGNVPPDFTRRAALSLDIAPTVGGTEPFYTFNLNNALSGAPFTEDPQTPTAIAGRVLYRYRHRQRRTTRTAEVFFDTGAQVTVVNELLAAQLGFDVVNDEPDFTVPIQGVGGLQTNIPGFVADSLTIPAVGGNFTATDVPIVVLTEIPNPLGSGILDGILGTNVFWDRDLAIDPTGSRLWISDPVTNERTHVTGGSTIAAWDQASTWQENLVPDGSSTGDDSFGERSSLTPGVTVGDVPAVAGRVHVSSDSAEPSVLILGPEDELKVSYDTRIADGGVLIFWNDANLVTSDLSIDEGGTLINVRSGLAGGTVVDGVVNNAGRMEAGFRINGDFTQSQPAS